MVGSGLYDLFCYILNKSANEFRFFGTFPFEHDLTPNLSQCMLTGAFFTYPLRLMNNSLEINVHAKVK